MIGLFGRWRRAREAPVDLAPMAARAPRRLASEAGKGQGAAIGMSFHPGSRCVSRADDGDARVLACGEVFDPGMVVPGARDAAALVLALHRADALDRLAGANGQFAAVIHDRARHALILVTDRLASVPLHVWRDADGVVFATQVHVLLGDARIPRRASPQALAQLFTLQRTIGECTPIAGVAAVPAATVLHVDAGGERERRYWQLAWRRPDFDRVEGARRLAAALRAALARQCDGPDVGLLLSGGLDSRMVLAAAGGDRPTCWTTASYADNPELALARRTAALLGAEHRTLLVDPAATLDVQDETVRDGGGMFPASTSVAAFMPRVAEGSRVALTGHGLDYTLRGYYLPSRFLDVAGSRTRLPALAPLPARPGAAELFATLRQGPPRRTIERIVRPERREEWFGAQVETIGRWLGPWLGSDEPANAWDAFILAQVSKHYAFTSMASVRSFVDLRIPAFDHDVLDVYLAMPPAWRVEATMAQQAMKLLSAEAAALPNANTGFRADLDSRLEIAALLGRAALRRVGLARRPATPTRSHSAGSWQNMTELFREDPAHRARFLAIRDRLDALCLGLLSPDGLAACIDEHLDGRAKHTKLLRQLLTHDSWVRVFEVAGLGA